MALNAGRFAEFYEAAHGYPPFPWQGRVAARAADPEKGWPRVIAVPTAAGKTAVIDMAVFALACQADEPKPTAARRVFFVVDRRVVVDQAYRHAEELAKKLRDAPPGILRDVADALRRVGGDTVRPLDVYALRGGMYREDAWVRTPLQPMVICSTVDQVGSRLLFRGYGVLSDGAKPVHAAVVGNDALIVLDEAHCSKPFAETMEAVQRYRGWNESLAPFHFVTMTATPTSDVPEEQIVRDDPDDRGHLVLGPRLLASKPAALVVAEKAKGKEYKKWGPELVKELAKQAKLLMGDGQAVKAVGVIVNRVQTARDVAAALRAEESKKPEAERAAVELVTGRMRPLDRDAVVERLRPFLSGSELARPSTYVVATQCLEVGADFDFDALVTECASLDALRQRFGRLNRVGRTPSAPAAVVVRAAQTGGGDDDPVYGASLAATWVWLRGDPERQEFDFGVTAVRQATDGVDLAPLNAPTEHAPVLLPAHLDCWVQTSPRPAPDPDPAPFLHGPTRPGVPDVTVVFRADLGDAADKWADVVALCPPSSAEGLAVRIDVFKRWLAGDATADDEPDVEGGPAAADDAADDGVTSGRVALGWAGPDDDRTTTVRDGKDVVPYGTYVVPTTADGVAGLGDFPPGGVADYADRAFQRSRDKALVRLTPAAVEQWPAEFRTAKVLELAARAGESDDEAESGGGLDAAFAELAEVTKGLAPALPTNPDGPWTWLWRAADWFSQWQERQRSRRRGRRRDWAWQPHPAGGFVITGKRRLEQFDPTVLDDEAAEVDRAVSLADHTAGVVEQAGRFAAGCRLPAALADAVELAARWHDLGKADPRFQAWLHDCSPRTAGGRGLLAKSARGGGSKADRDAARRVHTFPVGGRHELLSVTFAETALGGRTDDLVLHLIGTHHGFDRPFAPAYVDDGFDRNGFLPVSLLPNEQYDWPAAGGDPATANRTAPDRFWRVVRTHGWWGSAYLEAVVRLADWATSAAERTDGWEKPADPAPAPKVTGRPAAVAHCELVLTGLDGANPLGFLAALGTLRVAEQLYPGARLRWERRGRWVPVLELTGHLTEEELCDQLAGWCRRVDRDAVSFAEDVKLDVGEMISHRREASLGRDREFADFLAAYADPAVAVRAGPNAGRTSPTAFYMIAGQQRLLRFVRGLCESSTPARVGQALFRPWAYADAAESQSFRWDPREDFRYATRWKNPSKDTGPSSAKRTVAGANRLGFEALALFPCCVDRGRLATTGFRSIEKRVYFTWPVWSAPVGADACRSLAALAGLQDVRPNRAVLAALGVDAYFRAEKVANSDYSNFAPAAG